jgi:hypothetical protein
VSTVSRDEIIESLVPKMDAFRFTPEEHRREVAVRLWETLIPHSDRTLGILLDAINTDDGLDRQVAKTAIKDGDSSETINEMLHFLPALKLGPVETPGGVRMLVRGLRHVPHLQQLHDFSIAPDAVQQQCVTIMRVTYFLRINTRTSARIVVQAQHEKALHLNDPDLAELVLARYEQIDQILAALEDGRRTADSIRTVIDGTTASLANGTL